MTGKLRKDVVVKFEGDVFTLTVALEGHEVTLYYDGKSWNRTIESFEINPPLNVYMLCKGINGTAWQLSVTVDNGTPKTFKGRIKKGYSVLAEDLRVPSQ
jgi:hypothetical protein